LWYKLIYFMVNVYISSENIITSLGFTTSENAAYLLAGETGIGLKYDESIAPSPFYASLVNTAHLHENFSSFDNIERYTRFEQLAICSIKEALSRSTLELNGPDTIFILSTTKGNIDLLANINALRYGRDRIHLWNTARLISNYFNFLSEPLVVSTACISGVQAIITGMRLIRSGLYKNVVINGTDIITEFIFSGFNSFKSLSNGPCRPFDKSRDGLTLGEGSGTIILTSDSSLAEGNTNIVVDEGFSTNDANHISGPSRSGEGLFIAIDKLLKKKSVSIDYISAHGTATIYNDEMESIALTRAGLNSVMVNSFKGYWGHTLGAAGIIETIMCLHSMRNNVLFRSLGYQENGVTNPLNVIDTSVYRQVNNCLKIASGFGGCNAALLLSKK
jgi:3-oxoacyl-[acyl-carrier-protein] synthase I